MVLSLRPGMERDRDEVIHKLIDLHYVEMIWIFIAERFACMAMCWRFFRQNRMNMRIVWSFSEMRSTRITEIDVLTGKSQAVHWNISLVFPASHYVVPMDKILEAAETYRGRAW